MYNKYNILEKDRQNIIIMRKEIQLQLQLPPCSALYKITIYPNDKTNLHGIFHLQKMSIWTKDGNGTIVRHDNDDDDNDSN